MAASLSHYLQLRSYSRPLPAPDAIGGANIAGRPPEAIVYLQMQDGCISDAGFQCSGCGYLHAACSALLEMTLGKSASECTEISESELIAQLGSLPETKLYCVALAISALRNAIEKVAVAR